MATVTIGIPIYNEGKFLHETITSVLLQDFQDYELIISDNSSEDNSWQIIQEFADRDNRIKAFQQSTNIGSIENFKFCLIKAKSKYFVWLGGHDLFIQDYIKNAVIFLEKNPEFVMFYPSSKLVDGNDIALGYKDSNIDTSGLSIAQRMKKVANSLSWCTCFHGVFRAEILRKLPIKKVKGSDHLLLFAASSYGHIHFFKKLGILRRENKDESDSEIEKRRQESGVYNELTNKRYGSMAVLSLEHILFIIQSKEIPFLSKIFLVVSIMKIFHNRFNVGYLENYFAYVSRY